MKLQHKQSLISLGTLLLVCVFLTGIPAAAEQLVSIKGEIELKISRSERIEIKGEPLDDAVLAKDPSGWILRSKDGKEIARAQSAPDGSLLLNDGTGRERYVLDKSGNTYYIRRPPDKALVNRVKIKEDKFNIYDTDANRLRHGKQKPDGFGVKDQKGKQILKIKGTGSLEETSYLSVPIEPEFRILAWAAHHLK